MSPVPTVKLSPHSHVRPGDVTMRLVFAGTPEPWPCRRLDALIGVAPRARGCRHPSRTPRPGAAARMRPSPVPSSGRAARHTGAHARARRASPTFLRTAARPRARTAAPVVAYGALVAARRAGHPADTAGSTCTSRCCPPGAGRRPVQHAIMAGDEVTGATTFRLRAGTGHRPGATACMTEPIRPTDTSRRPARPARRSLARSCSSQPSTGSTDGTLVARPAASRRGVATRPRSSVDRRAGATGTGPPSSSTGRSGAAPRRPARGRPSAASASSSGPVSRVTRRRPGRRPRRARSWSPRPAVLCRHRDSSPVRLGLVQPHGKKPMPAADWARGVRIDPGEGLRRACLTTAPRRRGGADGAAVRVVSVRQVGCPAERAVPHRRSGPAHGIHGAARSRCSRRLCQPRAAPRAARAPADRAGRGVRHGAHLRGDHGCAAGTTRSSRSPPGARPRPSTRRSWTRYGSGRTSCSACECQRTQPPPRPLPWRGQVHGQGAAGFVNAVLRRVGERDLDTWLAAAAPPTLPPARAAGHRALRHPLWVVTALRAALIGHGRASAETVQPELVALLESDNAAPQVTLGGAAGSRRRGRAARGRSAARALGPDERDSAAR